MVALLSAAAAELQVWASVVHPLPTLVVSVQPPQAVSVVVVTMTEHMAGFELETEQLHCAHDAGLALTDVPPWSTKVFHSGVHAGGAVFPTTNASGPDQPVGAAGRHVQVEASPAAPPGAVPPLPEDASPVVPLVPPEAPAPAEPPVVAPASCESLKLLRPRTWLQAVAAIPPMTNASSVGRCILSLEDRTAARCRE